MMIFQCIFDGHHESGCHSNASIRGAYRLRKVRYLPRFADRKSFKLNKRNTYSKTGSQEVRDSIPPSSTR